MNNNLDEIELETMEDMAKRLNGTSGGEQAKAVIKAINAIKGARGTLDEINRGTALYHLAVALSGETHAIDTIVATAEMFNQSDCW